MHATHATIITTECTTRPQTSLLEIKFKLFTGKTTPAGKVREIFTGQGCRRAAINAAFTLGNVHSNDPFQHRLLVYQCFIQGSMMQIMQSQESAWSLAAPLAVSAAAASACAAWFALGSAAAWQHRKTLTSSYSSC